MIEVELPDGSIAEFPDGTPDDVMSKALQQYAEPQPQQSANVDPWDAVGANGVPGQAQQPAAAPAPDPTAMDYVTDVAKSGASGFARGVADLAGYPGTLADAINGGLSKLTGLPQLPASAVSGQSLRDSASYATDGATDYQAQTTPGKYASTVGEFAPGAIAFGGVNPTSIATNAVAPALLSEGAGQLTEGTALEPYARVAGALMGGVGANAVANRLSGAPKLPTGAQIKESAGYENLKPIMQEAKIDKGTFTKIINGIKAEADDFGMTTQQKGEFNGILNDWSKRSANGGSMYDLEVMRRSLANAGQDVTKPANQALSGRLVDYLDDAVDAIPGGSQITSSGASIDQTRDALHQAREIYRTGKKADIVEKAIARAQNQATGTENGLRVQFRKLLDDPKLSKNFSDVEKQAMQDVVKGNFSTNAMRWLGTFGVPIDQGRNFLGSITGGGVGGTIGGYIGGAPGATIGSIALPAIGTAAKFGAQRGTQNAASVAEALVKAGPQAGVLYGQAVNAADLATRETILRNLLQGQAAYQTGGR